MVANGYGAMQMMSDDSENYVIKDGSSSFDEDQTTYQTNIAPDLKWLSFTAMGMMLAGVLVKSGDLVWSGETAQRYSQKRKKREFGGQVNKYTETGGLSFGKSKNLRNLEKSKYEAIEQATGLRGNEYYQLIDVLGSGRTLTEKDKANYKKLTNTEWQSK
jgi:hypothetical protein